MYKPIIGEKISIAYKIFLIVYPKNIDEMMKVSYFPLLILGGTIYYADNTATILDANEELKKALSVETARRLIPNYCEGEKITCVHAYCNHFTSSVFTDEQEKRANEKLRKKLAGMTFREYLNR